MRSIRLLLALSLLNPISTISSFGVQKRALPWALEEVVRELALKGSFSPPPDETVAVASPPSVPAPRVEGRV